jgi:hypothetical protein
MHLACYGTERFRLGGDWKGDIDGSRLVAVLVLEFRLCQGGSGRWRVVDWTEAVGDETSIDELGE